MNYGKMKFDDTERAALIKNRKAIVRWIHEYVIPMLPHDSSIEISFGGTWKIEYASTPMYRLHIYASKVSIPHEKKADSIANVTIATKFGREESFEDGSDAENPYMIMPVVDNWSFIKQQIISERDALSKRHKSIFEFVI